MISAEADDLVDIAIAVSAGDPLGHDVAVENDIVGNGVFGAEIGSLVFVFGEDFAGGSVDIDGATGARAEGVGIAPGVFNPSAERVVTVVGGDEALGVIGGVVCAVGDGIAAGVVREIYRSESWVSSTSARPRDFPGKIMGVQYPLEYCLPSGIPVFWRGLPLATQLSTGPKRAN